MYGYIYITTNLVNGKKYIGQHKSEVFNPEYKGSGKLLRQALHKYGEDNFEVHIIEECFSKEELDNSEIKWIKYYDAANSREYYNLSYGGNSPVGAYPHPMYGKRHSEEARKKMSKSASTHIGEKNNFYGKKHTEESRKKMSESHKNNPSDSHTTAGRIWVNDGLVNKAIFPEELDEYLCKGYVKGFLSKKYDRATCLGRIWINNGVMSKSIYPSEFPEYELKGFVKGRLYNKVWMHKGSELRMIEVSEVDNYISQGYELGKSNRMCDELSNDYRKHN